MIVNSKKKLLHSSHKVCMMKKSKRDFLFSVLSVLFVALLMFAQFSSGMAVLADVQNDIAVSPNERAGENESMDGNNHSDNSTNGSGEISSTNNSGESSPDTSDTATSDGEKEDSPAMSTWEWILVAVAILLVIIIILAAANRKRKTEDNKKR